MTGDRVALLAKHPRGWPTLTLAVFALGTFVAAAAAALSGSLPWGAAVALQAIAAYACFTPFHDAAHHAISRSRRLDDLVGWVMGLPLLAPFPAFRALHLEHHVATNDPASDPDMWSARSRTLVGRVARWLVKDLHYLARYVSHVAVRPRREVVASGLGFAAIWGTCGVLAAAGHGVEVVVFWLVPARLGILLVSIVFDWIPHQPRTVRAVDDPYRATRAIERRWLTPLMLAQNYHLLHHLYPGVPFYRYGRAYWSVREELDRRRDARGDELEIVEIVEEARETRTFVFGVPAAQQDRYRYRAGQFVVVHAPSGTERLPRCYSLSRAPDAAGATLAITVKRSGRGSRALFALHVGAKLRVDPPVGRFVLRPGETRPVVLLAAGTGITPLIAIAEAAITSTSRRVVLVYAHRDPDHALFGTRIATLVRTRGDRFSATRHFGGDGEDLDVEAWVTRAKTTDADLYACGPPAFMAAVDQAVTRTALPAARFFHEHFTPVAETTAGPTADHFFAIHRGARHLVAIAPSETMLAAARRAGLAPRASCEEGYCGTCAARLATGRITTRTRGPLGDAELADGYVLPCSARPLSGAPVVIDLDSPNHSR